MFISEFKTLQPGTGLYNSKEMFSRYVMNRSYKAFDEGDAKRDSITTIDEFEKRRVFLKGKIIENMGGLPKSDSPLNPVITGVTQCDGFRIEKVIFESRPKNYVTTNIYVPDGLTSKTGAVLFACGHHPTAKHVEEYNIVCLYLVKAGLVVLAQDPVGQGERYGYYEKEADRILLDNEGGVIEHTYVGMQCLAVGDSVVKYFVHDLMRGVDYLCSREEVDASMIGITGNSGGGTQTSIMMVCDDRLAAAAPGTFIMNRRSFMEKDMGQDAEQIWLGMSKVGFDHEDILLAMAPKPVLVLAVKYDFFPIEGTRATVERCERFWDLYGNEGYPILFEDAIDHHYSRKMAQKAAEFFSEILNNNKITPAHEDVIPLDTKELICTKSGNVKKDLDDAKFVFDENLDRIKYFNSEKAKISEEDKKEKAIEWLSDRVLENRNICDINPRLLPSVYYNEYVIEPLIWASDKGLFTNAYIIRHFKNVGKKLPVTIALWEMGTLRIGAHMDKIHELTYEDRAVLVLDVTADGINLPDEAFNRCICDEFFGAIYKYTTDLFWLGDSLAALRVYDIITALNFAEDWEQLDTNDIKFYGVGRYGVYVLMAGLLDIRARNYEFVGLPHSIEQDYAGVKYYNSHNIISFIIPGMLKYFDVPELIEWTKNEA